MITLYTAPTPNGWKASVTLEELAIPYETKPIDMGANEQKEEWFLEINPNGLKDPQTTRQNFLVFNVVKGALKVKIHETEVYIREGGTFYVPPQNVYSCQNLLDEKAVLAFVQVRFPLV